MDEQITITHAHINALLEMIALKTEQIYDVMEEDSYKKRHSITIHSKAPVQCIRLFCEMMQDAQNIFKLQSDDAEVLFNQLFVFNDMDNVPMEVN